MATDVTAEDHAVCLLGLMYLAISGLNMSLVENDTDSFRANKVSSAAVCPDATVKQHSGINEEEDFKC